ncbi:MAG: hypothetical protein ABSG21_00455 [Spirochaetia bacterium]|jgi:hypothetical protein
MHSTEGLQRGPTRRARIWRFVVVTLLIAAIGEPIVMYLTLVREKEKRRAAAEITLERNAVR